MDISHTGHFAQDHRMYGGYRGSAPVVTQSLDYGPHNAHAGDYGRGAHHFPETHPTQGYTYSHSAQGYPSHPDYSQQYYQQGYAPPDYGYTAQPQHYDYSQYAYSGASPPQPEPRSKKQMPGIRSIKKKPTKKEPHSEPGERRSPRDKMNWAAPSTRTKHGTNPYRPLPPISSQTDVDEEADGYASMFLHKKEKKPEYKPYTLRDYRRMPKEVRLGTLGPDLDTDEFKSKTEKQNRLVNFGNGAMQRNKAHMGKAKASKFHVEKSESSVSNPHRARVEYARTLRLQKPGTELETSRDQHATRASPQHASALHEGSRPVSNQAVA